MKMYRLLRSNKESGPYSPEELIGMGLKAYDLVWADGKSAAWRYPSEIEELKAFAPVVEEQPFERFYKRKEENKTPVQEISYQATTQTIVKKEKPRIKIKADWRKIDPAVFINETTPVQKREPILQQQQPITQNKTVVTETPQTSWKDAWLDWEQEKKAVKSLPKYSEENIKVETKFSQSLSDIKEKYIETILKPRERKTNFSFPSLPKKYVLPAILFPLLGLGMWMGFTMKQPNDKNITSTTKPQSKQTAQPVTVPEMVDNSDASNNDENTSQATNDDVLNTDKNVSATSKTPAHKAVEKKLLPKTIVLSKQKNSFVHTPSANKNNSIKNNAVINSPSILQEAVHTNNVMQSNGQVVRNTVRRADNSNNIVTSTSNNIPAKNAVLPPKKIEDFVTVNAADNTTGNIQNYHLAVQNEVDFPIDFAVLDIQYFDSKGHFQKGETVYVNDIPASESVDVKIPDSKNSSRISYKVSLISAAQKKLYMIAD